MQDSVGVVAAALSVIRATARIANSLHNRVDQSRQDPSRLQDIDIRDFELAVELSLQKLLRWQELWKVDEKHPDFLERLWGQAGCRSIKELLLTLEADCLEIEDSIAEAFGLQYGGSKRGIVKRSHKFQKLSRVLHCTSRTKIRFEEEPTRNKIERLGHHIEKLWTLSEVCYRSHNRTYIGIPSPTHDEGLSLSKLAGCRAEAQALYRFCSWLSLDFDIEMDLFDQEGDLVYEKGIIANTGRRISYHLFNGSSKGSATFKDMLIEPLEDAEIDSASLGGAIYWTEGQDFKPNDLSWMASNSKILCVKGHKANSAFLFRVTRPSLSLDPRTSLQSLNSISDRYQRKNLRSGVKELPLLERLRVAYKVAECGLFLLGTPWLNHLSSDALRAVTCPDSQQRYVLRIQCSENKWDQSKSPDTLHLKTQISQIGLVLIQIALDRPSYLTELDDHEFKSSVIPSVERTMGQRYKQACNFCMTKNDDDPPPWDMRQSSFKYETSRKMDPDQILRRYYAEVFLR